MMQGKYILGIDQSTQGTKALLFDESGKILGRSDLPHKQIVNELGWVEHDPMEIYNNTINVVKELIEKLNVDKSNIIGIGITNQRETAAIWDPNTGLPIYNAIVWQCARGEEICKRLENHKELIMKKTGLFLSPYFTAAKLAWVLDNIEGAKEKSDKGQLMYGTMDSWLVYKLTKGQSFKTDYSNASRTQMFNINELKWDKEVCKLFGLNTECLAEISYSDSNFGTTDFEGFLDNPIPIHGVMGDSHAALFGQECHDKGMVKATYGTGSSIMMNIGDRPKFSKRGIVTSLAWGIDGKIHYVLEGNINYTGAVISWLKNDLNIIENASETQDLAYAANPLDKTYLVPAFTGLGAPHWKSDAKAIICGMTRITKKAEIVKAALESIAYQIADVIDVMEEESGLNIKELRVDGGPTRNKYLMQFQSDLLSIPVGVPNVEELSVIGVSYAAGIGMKLYDKAKVFENINRDLYQSNMDEDRRKELYDGWKNAVGMIVS
jgi:glycerol kinase